MLTRNKIYYTDSLLNEFSDNISQKEYSIYCRMYYRFLSSDMIQSKNVSLSSEFAISMIITDI